MEHGLSDAGMIRRLEDRIESLEKDVEIFAREASEAKYIADETSREVKVVGKDVAQLDEKFDALLDEIYAKDKSDFTSAERLQYAIDLGASEDNIRTYFESLMIANGELTEGFNEASAKVRLEELREIIDVYQKYRRSIVDEMLVELGGGDDE